MKDFFCANERCVATPLHGENAEDRGGVMRRGCGAFTLLELLVVVAIIGVLVALISPAIEKSVERSRLAVCGENLRVLSTGIHGYASEFNDALVVGPSVGSGVDAMRVYNRLGDAVAWIGSSAQGNGLGVLSKGWVTNARAFLCPFNVDPSFGAVFLKNMGRAGVDAYSSYMYRQMDQTDGKGRLGALGNDDAGLAATAVLMDWQSEGTGAYLHTSHDGNEFLNVVYADGHVVSFPNRSEDFVIREGDFSSMPGSYEKRIDNLWVKGDYAEGGSVAGAPVLP
jgi:prepilin-type N-terminal cleavage/methylation domain-containing protein/prepilin-type processing-associated H-X9-DG protein